jgi:hypothetical protein
VKVRSRRAGTAAAAALALLAAAVTPAQAYSSPRTVTSSSWNCSFQDVAVDRQGDAVMVWVRSPKAYPFDYRVQARTRTASGALGDRFLLSPRDQAAAAPHVDLDDDGDAVFAWVAWSGDSRRVYARRMSRAGSLGAVRTISGSVAKAQNSLVSVDPDGDALITWDERRSDGSVHPMARRLSRGGTLGGIVDLAPAPRGAETPRVAMDRQGDALVVWSDWDRVLARAISSTGVVGDLRTVYAAANPNDRNADAEAGVGRDGAGFITWRRWSDGTLYQSVLSRRVQASGGFGALRRLTPLSHDVGNQQVSSDEEGDVIVAWDRFDTGTVHARRISRTETVGDIVRVGSGVIPDITLDADGDGVIVWQAPGSGSVLHSIRSRTISRGGTFRSSVQVSPAGEMPRVDGSAAGRAVVVWERQFHAYHGVQVVAGP